MEDVATVTQIGPSEKLKFTPVAYLFDQPWCKQIDNCSAVKNVCFYFPAVTENCFNTISTPAVSQQNSIP